MPIPFTRLGARVEARVEQRAEVVRKAETDGWQLVFSPLNGELVVDKEEPDTFTAVPGLAEELAAHGVTRLAIAGMQSNYCIAASSAGAMGRGFSVVLASGAHATYDEDKAAMEISGLVEAELTTQGATILPWLEVTFT